MKLDNLLLVSTKISESSDKKIMLLIKMIENIIRHCSTRIRTSYEYFNIGKNGNQKFFMI